MLLSSGTSTIQRCRLVFRSLLSPAVEELCQTANSLIAPVRMGVARPTAPFQLAQTGQEALQGSEELFAVDPIVATAAGGQGAGAARARSPAPTLQPRASAGQPPAGPSAGGSGAAGGSVLYQLSREEQEDNDG